MATEADRHRAAERGFLDTPYTVKSGAWSKDEGKGLRQRGVVGGGGRDVRSRKDSEDPVPMPPVRSLKHTDTEKETTEQHEHKEAAKNDPGIGKSLLSFVSSELSWGKVQLRARKPKPAETMLNWMRVPLETEKFILVGYISCLDSFLHNFTYFPIRVMRSLLAFSSVTFGANKEPLHRAHVYNLLRALIILLSVLALNQMQISRVYHYIRGDQAFIKLYVIFNMLEIFDKLCCSVGQDCLDALYRATRDHPGHIFLLLMHVVLAVIYVVIHSLILFVQLISLNVAVNSQANAILTLLVTNNFVEVKGSVFKRFEPENLFQIATSDAVERFQMSIFMFLVVLQDAHSWDTLVRLVEMAALVFICEMIVDFLKHTFITKFNKIRWDVYQYFTAIICHDHLATRHRLQASLDPTHAVVRRLGFSTLPLMCVVIRFASYRLKRAPYLPSPANWQGVMCYVVLLACLFMFKVLLSLLLLAFASKHARMVEKVDEPSFNAEISRLMRMTRFKMLRGRIPV